MARVIVMGPLTGKTTMSQKYENFYDVDDAREKDKEAELQRLRHAGKWEEHNAIWQPMIAKFVSDLPKDAVVAVHSVADAFGAGVKPEFVFIPKTAILLDRAHKLLKAYPDQEERVRMAFVANNHNVEQAALNHIPVVTTNEEVENRLKGTLRLLAVEVR